MKRHLLSHATRLSVVAVAGLAVALTTAAAWAGTIDGTVSAARATKNLVVYVVKAPGHFVPPTKHPVMNQIHMKFSPHVLPVLVGTTVKFLNSDTVSHNVFSPDHEGYNLGVWPKGVSRSYTFKHAGVYTQLCSLHPEMEAYVVVLATPYFAVTAKGGHFAIKGIPKGHYELKVWGEHLHKKQKRRIFSVDVSGPKTTTSISL